MQNKVSNKNRLRKNRNCEGDFFIGKHPTKYTHRNSPKLPWLPSPRLNLLSHKSKVWKGLPKVPFTPSQIVRSYTTNSFINQFLKKKIKFFFKSFKNFLQINQSHPTHWFSTSNSDFFVWFFHFQKISHPLITDFSES